jgi:xylulokinase
VGYSLTQESEQLLGIDVGTTSLKAALFDKTGRLVTNASTEYPTFYPQPGWAEHEPELWWEAFKKSVHKVLSAVHTTPSRIAGLAVSELSPVIVPVDEHGYSLRRAIIWMDRREYRGRMTQNPVAKQLWIRDSEPQVFKKTYKFLNASGFIYYRLTGEFASYESLRVPDELLEKQPRTYFPTQLIGTVSADSSRETSLAHGTPVVMGSYDNIAATLGAGIVRPGLALDMTGHSSTVLICTDKRVHAPYCFHHPISGLWLIAFSTTAGGGLLRWFRDNFASVERTSSSEDLSSYRMMDAKAAAIEPGAAGLIMLPYLGGKGQEGVSPDFNPAARGTIFGLTSGHTQGHLIRMFLEANAYEIRWNIEKAESLGLKINDLRVADGGARSDLWLQIKADVLGRPLARMNSSVMATPFGDALMAGVGVGVYRNLYSACDELVEAERLFKPQASTHELYSRFYRKYLELDMRLRDMYH